ncbi:MULTISPECIES: NAD-dependent epimerase/dehydratase family protein [unclassified Chelatococcus]|uniref:NAD-dependent epimerase/dehydratase family protein n=1 Tax=unclassified Chelatococcus TaxID=2638111 RepID=UPI001BCE2EAC|nr:MULTISPECIES: NAD-dependent epimerase/dehydratase family protein [unclassified Chelatococcus]MBS7696766.1 NAD-dependent epimerase/dehydratase family protein [Chelatococcus sp. YT9]MBX3555331.1 NAD-dependent epimerase/dehydratase family protein [Chelatococcus sp.]
MARRVLLTGATGFVGRHLITDLMGAGIIVRAATRRPAALPAGVEQVVVGDLDRPVDWSEALAGVDAVVHAAGIAHAGPGIAEERYHRVNTEATVALAKAAGPSRRFLFISSIRAQSGPTATHVLTEADVPRPEDAYGRSKLAAEQALAELGGDWVALRPVLVYGQGVGGNMGALLWLARLPIPLPVNGLKGRRSLVAVETLAGAVRHCLALPAAPRSAFIVADPQSVTVGEIVAALREGMGRRPGLFTVPEGLSRSLCMITGRSEAWTRLTRSLEVDAAALRQSGFVPQLQTRLQLRLLAAGSCAPRTRG